MTADADGFDAPCVRESWDRAGAGFDRAQTSGIDYYQVDFFGPVECTWERFGETTRTLYMHAPLEDWFAWFLGAGFRLRAFGEPCPTADALRARPELEDAARVPYYAFFDLVKPA